ncbi:MAG TPA: helix-turn-helix domain-containing protein [Planctomycetota bacterium]|nr:helix-turn-helix domain-containing protein [Planctomycetota bacterium]
MRAQREALGLKQVELAELAACSTRFVHSVEADKATLRLDKLVDLLEVLGLGLRLVRMPGLGVASDLEADLEGVDRVASETDR